MEPPCRNRRRGGRQLHLVAVVCSRLATQRLDSVIALAAKRSERIDADRQVKQAEIVARKEVDTTDVSREQALETARIARRRAIEQLDGNASVQLTLESMLLRMRNL